MENFVRHQKQPIYSLDPEQGKQLSMFIKFSLDRRSSTDGVERPIQSIPSARRKVLLASDMNEKKIFTKERKGDCTEHL